MERRKNRDVLVAQPNRFAAHTPRCDVHHATKEQHAEVLTQVWLTNAESPIGASDGELPLVPLGTDEKGIPSDRPHRGDASQCRVHDGLSLIHISEPTRPY